MSVVGQIRVAIERVGWSEASRRSGLSRENLHRCFGKNGGGKNGRQVPTLRTIERLLPHIGLQFTIEEWRP